MMIFEENNPTSPTQLEHLFTKTVQDMLSSTSTPGASVALFLDRQPLFVSAVGFKDLDRTTLLGADARFYIYSVTKSLIATLVLQLAEQGLLTLDDPVQAYLPHLPIILPVTLRQILNHTAGIPDYGALPAYFEALKADPKHPWSSSDFLTATLKGGLDYIPGQSWKYSNIGFLLLRLVIEAVSQTSLGTAMRDHIFAPLKLRDIQVAQSIEDGRLLTPGYSALFETDGTFKDIRLLYHPGWVSHGVVIATAYDLGQVFEAIFSGHLLTPSSRAAMLAAVPVPVRHSLFVQPAYGLGLMVDLKSPYGLIAGHAGGGPGYSAAALHFPDLAGHKLTSIALANRDQDEIGLQISYAMAKAAGTLLAKSTKTDGIR